MMQNRNNNPNQWAVIAHLLYNISSFNWNYRQHVPLKCPYVSTRLQVSHFRINTVHIYHRENSKHRIILEISKISLRNVIGCRSKERINFIRICTDTWKGKNYVLLRYDIMYVLGGSRRFGAYLLPAFAGWWRQQVSDNVGMHTPT
jgi:hypothetical protein